LKSFARTAPLAQNHPSNLRKFAGQKQAVEEIEIIEGRRDSSYI
jgi:hypothetical protein